MQARRTTGVVRAHELDGSPCELDRAAGRARFAGELGGPGAELGEVEPGELRRVRDCVPERDRPLEMRAGLRQAEDRLRLACRFDRRGERLGAAAGGGPVGGELRGCRGVAARELLGEPRVQFLALAGQDRPVDRFRQERVTEAEAAGRLLRDEDTVLDGPAQRLAHLVLRLRRYRAEQRVPDASPGGRGHAQEALRRTVEPRHTLEQQLAQAARERIGPVGGREELLGEERVTFGAGGDRVRQGGRHRGVGAGRQQRRQRVTLERPEVEQRRRARAPNAVGESAHPPGRAGVVGAIGREQENVPVVEVVSEEDDQVERRRVGPMQVLQHQQHGCDVRALGEQRERVLEHPQLRDRGGCVDPPNVSERTQRLGERLVRELCADQIDRTPEQDLESLGARSSRDLGRQAGLADARFPRDECGHARFRTALARARARAPRAHVDVRRRPRWREPPSRPVSRDRRPSPPEDTDTHGRR